ncbi:hypothetical protein ADUPG1_005970, partial [Aduncisulcus paluster]
MHLESQMLPSSSTIGDLRQRIGHLEAENSLLKSENSLLKSESARLKSEHEKETQQLLDALHKTQEMLYSLIPSQRHSDAAFSPTASKTLRLVSGVASGVADSLTQYPHAPHKAKIQLNPQSHPSDPTISKEFIPDPSSTHYPRSFPRSVESPRQYDQGGFGGDFSYPQRPTYPSHPPSHPYDHQGGDFSSHHRQPQSQAYPQPSYGPPPQQYPPSYTQHQHPS